MKKKTLEKKYGAWTVLWKEIRKISPSWREIVKVLCRCDCWTEKYVQKWHLFNWTSKNCWCLKAERIAKIWREHVKHGMEWTIPYRKFMAAKARCERPSNDSYYRYGARGIKVEWSDFSEFWKDMWASYYEHIQQHGEKNTTLERIDMDWNYCKENCKWATWAEQYENMSTNHPVFYRWTYYPTIASLCKENWKKYWLVRDRIRRGWSVEDAMDLPLWATNYVKKTKRQNN